MYFVDLVRRKLTPKAQKHYTIKTSEESKLNSIKDLISKALQEGQISDDEFKTVLCELEEYYDLKDKTKQSIRGLRKKKKERIDKKRKRTSVKCY